MNQRCTYHKKKLAAGKRLIDKQTSAEIIQRVWKYRGLCLPQPKNVFFQDYRFTTCLAWQQPASPDLHEGGEVGWYCGHGRLTLLCRGLCLPWPRNLKNAFCQGFRFKISPAAKKARTPKSTDLHEDMVAIVGFLYCEEVSGLLQPRMSEHGR